MKGKMFFLLITFCAADLALFAQDTTYFDKFWHLSSAVNAAYFRTKVKKDAGWEVTDHYISGSPQMTGAYRDDSCKRSEGAFAYYDEKRHLYHRCHYTDGQLEGSDVLYYENNQQRTVGNYKSGKKEGEWLGYYSSGKLSARATFVDGEQVAGKFFNEDGSTNMSVSEFNRSIGFPGGLPSWTRFLIRNLQYPQSAIKQTVQGTVYVSFDITKEGETQNIAIAKSVDPALDKEALRVIALMPSWEPLIIGGIPCDSHQSQPINFVLREN